jgi:hypothetical protein
MGLGRVDHGLGWRAAETGFPFQPIGPTLPRAQAAFGELSVSLIDAFGEARTAFKRCVSRDPRFRLCGRKGGCIMAREASGSQQQKGLPQKLATSEGHGAPLGSTPIDLYAIYAQTPGMAVSQVGQQLPFRCPSRVKKPVLAISSLQQLQAGIYSALRFFKILLANGSLISV